MHVGPRARTTRAAQRGSPPWSRACPATRCTHLTDGAIGLYTGATIFALLSAFGVSEENTATAWWLLLVVGLVVAVPTAVGGVLDWLAREGTGCRRLERFAARRVRAMVVGIRLDHSIVAISDWESSNRFYRDVIGADLVQADDGRMAYRLEKTQLNVHGPGVDLSDNVARHPVRPGNSDLCFAWPGSIDEAIAHLAEHGVEIETGPVRRFGAGGHGMSVYFRDPDGSLLEFISY